jgi:cardiolipin synthase
MNIRESHCVNQSGEEGIQDLHFKIEGPIVLDLQEVFVEDWYFATGEKLEGAPWFGLVENVGETVARCIPDGPDRYFEHTRWVFLGAIAQAEYSLRIMTPYFLPDAGLLTALNTAALRGVRVQIILPQKNNLPWVQWAMQGTLWQVLERGCEVYFSPAPFDHSKLILIDNQWFCFGSANWDARSLRLNFELNVECYESGLATRLNQFLEEKINHSAPLSMDQLNERTFATKLRDGIARLFSPYL